MQGITHAALSHEFTHFVEELSAEKFRKFTDILFDVLGKNDVDVNRLIEAKEAVLRNTEEYKGRSDEDLRAIAYSEVVAEMMEPVLTDTDAISRISQKIKQQDKSLWGKIKDFIKGIVEKLKAAYRGMEPDSAIARLTRETVTNSEAVLDAFSEAAADAVLNYNLQDGQKNNAREGEQFSTRENKNEVAQMREVSSVSAYDGSLKATDIVNKVSEFFESIGGSVNNKELGTISLRRRGIKNDVSHGIGREKAASFMAVPDILQKGKIVDYQTNWKGRGYDTAVIAAPIKIAGVDYLAGVCVKRTSTDSNFYVHEVLPIKNEGTMPFNRAALESVDSGGDAPSINSILLDILAVKGNFLKSSRDSDGNALTEAQQRYFADSQVRDEDGNLKVVYHGSPAIFTEFSADFMSSHGSSEGQGFYFTDYKPMAEGYQKSGGQLLEGYLNIQKPLSDSEVTLKRAEVRKLLKALDPTGDDLVLNYDSGGGMGYPSRSWYNRALNDTLNAVMGNESDSEILGELANAMGNSGAVLEKVRSVLGYDGYIVSGKYDNANVYVAFDSSQFKNADNQNPTGVRDFRYSARTSSDSEYLNLAQNPEKNREALSRMVEQAAKEAGYDSPMLYHGTQSFGFTNFDLDKMDDKRSIFLTSNPDIAATYSGVDGSRNIGKASGTDISTLSLQEVAQMMNQFPPESGMDYQYSVVESKAEISGQVDRGLNELNNLINTLKKQYGKDSKEYGRLEKLQNTLYLGTNDGLSTQLWMILKQTDLFKGHEDFVNGLEQNLRLLKKAPESGSFLVEKALGGYSIDVLSEADAKEELAQNMQRGNYALYARLGNTLTVEGEGQRWNNLKNWAKGMEVDENSTYVMEDDGKFFLLRKADDSVVENGVIDATEKARELSPDALQFLLIQKANTSLRILTEVATTTRDVTKWAKNAGYDSVIFKNIKDSGGQNNSVSMDTTADIYAIFNPNNAKSADAVTYDDNGNVIPLSQRFDMGKEDIRYSARYAAAEENPEIANLVQRVLSGDFKANDKVHLGTVSSQNAARIQEITGINVDGFRVAIEARQIEHILNRHGIEGSADHSMAQVSDISKIGYILSDPDNISPAGKTQAYTYMRNGKNRTADTVIYEKGIGEKTYYAVQAVPDTKAKTLYIVTAFIQKNSKGASQLIGANGSNVNVRDGSVVTPTGNVAQTGTNVKGENLESRRVSQEVRDAIEEYRRQQDVQSKAYRQMYERQLEEVKKSYQKQISSMESEYSANLAQIQDAFFQTVEAYEKGQFRNEHLEKVLKQAAETQRAQEEASEADNATWEKEFNRLLRAYETSGRNVQRLKQTVENQRARAKAKVEAARVTEQRGKLYRAVNEINRRLLNPTKTLYVPDSLAPAVTKFMQGLTEAMESPKNSWNVQGALETLQEQYRKLTQMNEGVFTQEYNQGILDLLDNAISAVGGTDFNKLSASQIEDVYSAVRSVLTAIRNENKMFAANLNKTYAEAAAAVRREEAALPNRKPTTGAVQDKAEKFGWNQLKPVYAMMRLGSDTLLKQYNNLRAGEDKWQRVIAAARAYGLGTMAKYNYDQWDDSLMKLDTETGTVELSLQERMSLYAYARREQAFEHLTKGGFVLSDKNTRTVKNRLGIETEQI